MQRLMKACRIYRPKHQTYPLWSNRWRRSGIWERCRCFCQTLAWPPANPAASPHLSAHTHTLEKESWFQELYVIHTRHLCKILLWYTSSPFDAQLQRSAGVWDIGTFDQHSLHQNTVFRNHQDALHRLILTITLRKHDHIYHFPTMQPVETKLQSHSNLTLMCQKQQPSKHQCPTSSYKLTHVSKPDFI